MMNYEIFREVVAEKFKDFLPKEYEGLDVIVNPTRKVNQELDGLTLRGDGVRVAPTIYINSMYEQYNELIYMEKFQGDAATSATS